MIIHFSQVFLSFLSWSRDLLIGDDHYQRMGTMGWANFAVKGLEVHRLPGNRGAYLGEDVQATAGPGIKATTHDDAEFPHYRGSKVRNDFAT